MAGHPLGPLMIQHGNSCTIRDSEDSRQLLDFDTSGGPYAFTRAATDTELLLLAALGYEHREPESGRLLAPAPDDVRCEYSTGLRNRQFRYYYRPTETDPTPWKEGTPDE